MVILVIVALAFFASATGDDDDPTPTPTSGFAVTTDEGGGESTVPTDTATTLVEPYESLGVKPITGCENGYSCLNAVSFAVATTDGLRETTLPPNSAFRLRVTITNPTPFEAAITQVTHSDTAAFPRQNTTVAGGVPLCPDLGDPPIKLAARSDTTCEMAFKFTDDTTSYLSVGVDTTYLWVDGDGVLDEETERLTSNDLATLTVRPPPS